jgi:hypothetical protein
MKPWLAGVGPKRSSGAGASLTSWRKGLSSLRGVTFEIHAGSDYRNFGLEGLIVCGASVEIPIEGVTQGQQLRFYMQAR